MNRCIERKLDQSIPSRDGFWEPDRSMDRRDVDTDISKGQRRGGLGQILQSKSWWTARTKVVHMNNTYLFSPWRHQCTDCY